MTGSEADAGTPFVRPRALSPGRIDLWIARPVPADEDDLSRRYRSLLTSEEREQEKRFRFDADRRRYLVTRALVRTTLSLYASCRPRDWRFSPTPYGRPEIVHGGEGLPVSFNLSHTDGMILLAVTGGPVVGVDVENISARAAPLGIANRFFAPEEVRDLEALPAEAQARRFWDYWTLKESYIKALGMGLSIPLDSFYFRFGGDRTVALHDLPGSQDAAERWRLWQFLPDEGFLAALCVEDSGERPEVCAFEVVPLVSCAPVPFAALRCSPPKRGEGAGVRGRDG